MTTLGARLPRGVLLPLGLGALLLAACGTYRPASALDGAGEASELLVSVPSFRSYVGYPELDVHAARHLSRRLADASVRTTSGAADVVVEGELLEVRDQPSGAAPGSVVYDLGVVVQLRTRSAATDAPPCETARSEGRTTLVAPDDAEVQAQWLDALQSCTDAAIDEAFAELLGCLADTAGARTAAAEGD